MLPRRAGGPAESAAFPCQNTAKTIDFCTLEWEKNKAKIMVLLYISRPGDLPADSFFGTGQSEPVSANMQFSGKLLRGGCGKKCE